MVDVGAWLVERRGELDRGEAGWLERLAEFDRDGLWAAEGQLSCVSWLVWRTNMGRSTAFDKLRVAHQLARRPIVAEAFVRGRLSYSAVRAITRLDRPDPGVDEALVALAESGQASILDIERVVRSYHLYAGQDRPPPDEAGRARGVRIVRGGDGTGQVIVSLSDLEVEEFAAALQAFVDRRYRPRPGDESSPEDRKAGEGAREDPWRPGDESSAGDGPTGEAPLEEASRPAQTADAFMDLVGTALGHAGSGQAAGDDRYLVHLVSRPDSPGLTTLDGRPLHPGDAAMVACDTSTVSHVQSDGGEPLNLGGGGKTKLEERGRPFAFRSQPCSWSHEDLRTAGLSLTRVLPPPPGPQNQGMEHRPTPGHQRPRRRPLPLRRLPVLPLRHPPHPTLGG